MEDVLKKNNVWRCYPTGSVPFIIFDIITFIYLCLLQFVGIILAFQTRKVNIKALNDSKCVTVLIHFQYCTGHNGTRSIHIEELH